MDHRHRYFQEVDVSRTKPFLFGLILGAGLSFIALRYHVVRYSEGFMLVPRTDQPPIRSAYADVREWGTAMWKQYPELAAALVADGQAKLVADSLTDDLLGRATGDNAESFDLLPDEQAAAPKSPAPEGGKTAPSPIRLTPAASERRVAPERPARLSQPADVTAPRVSMETASSVPADQSAVRVRSALETLFAPYGAAGSGAPAAAAESAPSSPGARSSVPVPAAEPTDRVLDLKDIEIDLGPARQVIPASSIPHQAASAGLFSPRRVYDAAKVAASPTQPASGTAVSTAPTYQFPLK
ncbi:hypothetical protein Pan44_48280 [Caulifigura coniformis]|uniref:Uncharacterized protein n=1 Tax=Caulifigura coniformis TaxID=2527983 RepID=A0A517SKY0_9PLAN|nr:hypothetical protein [Caulifigura coniformis]QDT56768.1 hypothetical protein Pan44_48280 [Caulifigura coniformis]